MHLFTSIMICPASFSCTGLPAAKTCLDFLTRQPSHREVLMCNRRNGGVFWCLKASSDQAQRAVSILPLGREHNLLGGHMEVFADFSRTSRVVVPSKADEKQESLH